MLSFGPARSTSPGGRSQPARYPATPAPARSLPRRPNMASRKIVLHFPPRLIEEPVICRLAKQFDLEFNILRASITPHREGRAALELIGESEDITKGVEYVRSLGLRVDSL